ncbi:MAG TPA: LysR family transcriptional regulator [Pseudonocardiaceae bacterium]|jgi:DNA-binding transcriptional LysR family regulator|nr:LysR family transcriptional regulator [Pseudonocardiaceae bacterium]
MSGLPDVTSLRLLVLVGEQGSLGRAAAALRIAQPSASKRLATLERGLGLALVDRSHRGSVLTPAGVVVAGWARRVLDELDALVTGTEALRAERNAALRVAASMTVAEYLAPAWIGELRRRRPDLYVALQVTNSERVAELVRAGDVDVGFVESPGTPSGLSARRVATDQLVVVVAPGHPWTRRRRPLTAAELAATPLVMREHGSGTRETVEHAFAAVGVRAAAPVVELGSTTAVRGAVLAGAGPAVISELAVVTELADGRLVRVDVPELAFRRALHAVWPGGRRLGGPAAELLAVTARSR